MQKRQLVILLIAIPLISVVSLLYSAQVLADLRLRNAVQTDALNTQLILTPQIAGNVSVPANTVDLGQFRQVVDARLEKLHLAGAYHVTVQGDRLLVRLPKSENMAYISSVVASVGEIEFIDGGPAAPPVGQQVNTGPEANPAQNIYRTLFTGQEIESAVLPDPAAGQIFYQLTLRSAAFNRVQGFIQARPERYICMVMDRQVLNCSQMYHWLDNRLMILPGLSSGAVFSLSDLAIFLASGPLPAPLKVELP